MRGVSRLTTKKNPDETPEEPAPALEEPGRLRSAWSVLKGQRLVPLQIQFEWIEYQQIFDDVLKRFSAQLARGAKAEKKRLKSALSPETPEAQPVSSQEEKAVYKARLRSRVAAQRGVGRPAMMTTPVFEVAPPNGEEP